MSIVVELTPDEPVERGCASTRVGQSAHFDGCKHQTHIVRCGVGANSIEKSRVGGGGFLVLAALRQRVGDIKLDFCGQGCVGRAVQQFGVQLCRERVVALAMGGGDGDPQRPLPIGLD